MVNISDTANSINTLSRKHIDYTYNILNQLEKVNDINAPENILNLKYDIDGNLTSDGKGIYEYDVFGHMIRAELGSEDNLNAENKNTFICRYDAEGLRYEVEENERLIRYIYKDRDVLSEESEDEGTKRYIRGNGRLIASDSEKARTYYHYVSDNIGSIHYVINSGNESVENDLGNTVAENHYDLKSRIDCHYEYDAFGNVIQSEEKIRNIFRFTGEKYDQLTGQYYLKARYYNPVIGRFTQMDTYLGDGLNLYAYVQNNPVRYVDPSGHCKEGIVSARNTVGSESGSKGGSDVIKNSLVNKVKDIRAKMPNTNLAKRGNMAVADVDVIGIKDNFVAHSKINAELDKGADVADFSYLKPENERIFTSYVDDQYPRYHDTEAKILEDIASQITDPNVSGRINLYSELPCCQSCSNIILEFRRMFLNIELNIFVE